MSQLTVKTDDCQSDEPSSRADVHSFARSFIRFASVRFVSSNGAHEPREPSTSLSQSQSQSTSTAFSFIDLVAKVFLDSALAI